MEAKECLKRGLDTELPLFFDFPNDTTSPMKSYILGLEKMGLITPLFR